MKEIILIKYGEIILKGLNRHIFEDRLVTNIIKVVGDKARVYKSRATIYAEPASPEYNDEIVQKVSRVFGVVSVTRAAVCEKNLESILEVAKDYLKDELSAAATFKVETKRADKTFPLKSPEVSREIGGGILAAFRNLSVDVKTPDVTLNVEVRESAAYVYANKISGPGGMPTGSSSKAMLLLSGGIDSPVAGYQIAKRGAVLEAVHFFAHPFTSQQAKEKVLELAKILSGFTGGIKVHVVPFTKPQLTIIMRRMMMMISSRIAKREGALCLITGESLGQVASQTMEAIAVTDNACDIPCFRPLIGMDKEDIITIAKKIDTFETSILPYEDCCTIFVPKHPTTKPRLEKILESESKLEVEELVAEAIENTEVITVTP